MKAYTLIGSSKGKYLVPQDNFNTVDFVTEHSELSLIENLVDDGKGNKVHRYRLHSREPMSYSESLEFDISCPHCQDNLRVCGDRVDVHNHGLYKCRSCDERSKR